MIWFFLSSFLIIVYSFFKWRQPTNGHIFAQIFSYGARKIIGIKSRIDHQERLLTSQPCIYIVNHQDVADILLMAPTYPPDTAVIGKKELMWVPFFGQLFYVTGNILLHRQKHDAAMMQMQAALDYVTKKNHSVYMFPEGTRGRGSPNLLPFKKGAFRLALAAQVPLVPIVGSPNKKVVDVKNKIIHVGKTHIVDVLEPIPTKGLHESDIDSLMDRAHSVMQAAFDRLKDLEN